ncbi:myosin-11-like isoform X2 [Penaeus chinensis]|nr:myosin-11-like isoform X2 [Penaeus chinensis]
MSSEDDLQLLDQQLDSRLQRLQDLWISSNNELVTTQQRASQASHREPEDCLSRTSDTITCQNFHQKYTVGETLNQKDAVSSATAPFIHGDQKTGTENAEHLYGDTKVTREEYQPSVYIENDKTCSTEQQNITEIKKRQFSTSVAENSNEQVSEEKQEPTDDPLEEGEENAIFDEFLDQSTRYRISSLCKKVTHLNGTISVLQEECKRLSSAKKEACTKAHTAETERRTLNKQVLLLQQQTTKLQKSNKQLQGRVQELNTECQGLRKELSSHHHSESEHRSSQSSFQAQLTRAHSENASLREQITTLKNRHKEELDQLRTALGSSNSKVKELERQQRNMSALVKKQDKLIGVINEQKNNLAAAKAAAGLEEKFLNIITPLQPP